MSPTMAAVPSGELSSTTSTSRSADWANTSSTTERMFSFSLYVGMMTNARSLCVTLFRLLRKPRIRQHDVGPLMKCDRPFLVLHLLDNLPYTLQNRQGIYRIDADWQLYATTIRKHFLLGC